MEKKITIYLKPIEKYIELDDNLTKEEQEMEETRQILDELEEEILSEASIDYWE